MTATSDYLLRGGFTGIVQRQLVDERLKAVSNPAHPLHESVTALKAGDSARADELEREVIASAPTNPSAPEWLKRLATLQCVSGMAELFHALDRSAELDKAGREAVREGKSKAGQGKAREQRRATLEAWQKYVCKKPKATYTEFAKWYFNSLGGRYDSQAKKFPGVPAQRTIARWVSKYCKESAIDRSSD